MSGSPMLDVIVPGLGRIARHIGTDKPGLVKDVRAVVRMCLAQGRLDVLERLRDNVITPLQLYDAFRSGRLDRLANADTLAALLPKLEEFERVYPQSEGYQKDCRLTRVQVERIARAGSTLADLPKVLKRMRERYEREGAAVTFNRHRRVLMAFAQWACAEKRPPLWYDLAKVLTIRPRAKAKPEHVTPALAHERLSNLPPEHAAIAWSILGSGMNWKELTEDGWEQRSAEGYIAIHGQKRPGRERIVPYIFPIAKPTRDYRRFRIQLHRVAPLWTPHFLRHVYGQWLEDVGLTTTVRNAFMGHLNRTSMRDLYADRVISPEVCRAAGKRLRAHIGRAGVLKLEARSA